MKIRLYPQCLVHSLPILDSEIKVTISRTSRLLRKSKIIKENIFDAHRKKGNTIKSSKDYFAFEKQEEISCGTCTKIYIEYTKGRVV